MFKKCMIVLAAALCVVSLTACGNQKAEAQQQTAQAEAVADLKIGAPAPDIDLPAADGKSVKLSQLYAQGPVFINFWASWCPPCVGEMPDIQKAYDAHKQEIQFIAVNMDQKKDDGVAFWRDGKYTIPMYQPNIQKVSRDYRISGIPMSVLVDTRGIIVNIRVGSMDEKELEEFLNSISKK